MNAFLTNRVECYHRTGGLTGLAESSKVHSVHSELVLKTLDQVGDFVTALQAWELVLPHPQDCIPLLPLNPVTCNLAATISIWYIPLDADCIGRHRHHIWTSWRTWRNCRNEEESSTF